MKKKVSLFSYITTVTVTLIVVFILAFLSLYAFDEYKNFNDMKTKMKADSLNQRKETLKKDVKQVVKHILVQREMFIDEQKEDLDKRVKLLSEILNLSLAKQKTKYKEPRFLISPLLLEYEVAIFYDEKEQPPFLKSGYCAKSKLATQKLFFQLCVPQTILEKRAKAAVIESVELRQEAAHNPSYLFIGDFDGVSQTFPAKGKNMIELQDKNGVFIVKELIKKAKSGGGFVTYVLPPIDKGLKSSEKISYTEPIHVWDWYVGAGVLVEDLEAQIQKLEKKMFFNMKETIFLTLFISFMVLVAFFIILSRTQKRVQKDFDIFKGFLGRLVESNEPIDKKTIRYREFEEIANQANIMLEKKTTLEKRLDLYRLIVNTIGDFMSFVDRDYKYLAVNDTYAEFFGKKREEIEGFSARELFGDEIFENNIKPLNDRALQGESFTKEVFVRDKKGEKHQLQSSYFPYYENNETLPKAFVLYARNITKEHKAKEKIDLWEKVFARTSEAVLIMNEKKEIIQVNKAFSAITGYDKKEILSKSFHHICAEENCEEFLDKNLFGKGYWVGEVENKRKNKELYPALLNTNIIKNEQGRVSNYVAIFTDITNMKESQKQLEYLAKHDVLTKLPNRLLLTDRIEHAIKNAKRNKKFFGICFIDLDDFKKINDSYGHSYGDEVLKQVAERISLSIRSIDTLSRIGGDEFILLLEEIKTQEEIVLVVEKIQEVLKQPFEVRQKRFFLTASIGICMYPYHGKNVEELLKNADIAMYKAKEIGKNVYSFFTEQMSIDSFHQVSMEEALKEAIIKKEFVLYYQPQINLKDGSLVGLEALIRWRHPREGILSPAMFINFAESSRMIVPIGEFVLEQACADAMRLKEMYGYQGRISINVSGIQIEYGDFFAVLNNTIEQSKIEPNLIELEITESVFMSDPEQWINLLEKAKRIGVKVAIDDFGTGYSSLSYLKELPIDTLKIDMSFVKDVPYDRGACSIVQSIIDLAKNMNLKALAEGIETNEQADFLKTNGCLEGQGYLYSKPLDFDTLVKWLKLSN